MWRMEWTVLSGGKNTIKANLPIVVAETHRIASDMMQYDCMTPIIIFLQLGYRTFSLDENDELVNSFISTLGLILFSSIKNF